MIMQFYMKYLCNADYINKLKYHVKQKHTLNASATVITMAALNNSALNISEVNNHYKEVGGWE